MKTSSFLKKQSQLRDHSLSHISSHSSVGSSDYEATSPDKKKGAPLNNRVLRTTRSTKQNIVFNPYKQEEDSDDGELLPPAEFHKPYMPQTEEGARDLKKLYLSQNEMLDGHALLKKIRKRRTSKNRAKKAKNCTAPLDFVF